jgi:glycosyltransferase involved in cell wall biosynthesis
VIRSIGVMHVVHTLNVGGAEKLVYDLSRAVDRDRFRPVVACLDEAGKLAPGLRDAGVPVEVLHRKPGLRPDLVLRLAGLIRRHRIDVVHAHQYTPWFYGLLAARTSRRATTLLTEHGRHHPDVRKPRRVLANQALWRLNGQAVAVSEFTRQALIHNDGFPEHAVSVLYNGVDLRRFEDVPDRAAIRAGLDIDPNAPVMGTCARMSPEKNLPMMVEAFAATRQKHPNAVLAIAGDGPARPDVEAKRDALGLGDSVRLLGFRDDVPSIVSMLDVFCLSSLTEGTSVTLLEAMYAARPAVVTDVGGNPEIVVAGETGRLVPSGDAVAFGAAVLGFFDDPDSAAAFGAAGRARVEARFTFQGMVHAYERLYETLAR